jgi:anaerobic sulfite reductase subunit C
MSAWTRSKTQYYRLVLMGRTGKRNPRMAEDFVKWIDEESIIKIILNTYDYVKQYIDLSAPGGKEHIGYIIDRTGFEEYKKWALKGVTLPPIAEVTHQLYWGGKHY